MNRLHFLPATRWSYSPVSSLQSAMDRLQEARAIGHRCFTCNKVLIDHIIIKDARKYHEECYLNIERATFEEWESKVMAFSGFFFILLSGLTL